MSNLDFAIRRNCADKIIQISQDLGEENSTGLFILDQQRYSIFFFFFTSELLKPILEN